MSEFTNMDDVIDVRDIISRVEEIREARDEYNEKMADDDAWANIEDGEPEELETLEALLEELKGCGGDEQWEGEWYPATLIRDSYFEDYAQELAEDCGLVNVDAKWPNNCIDWEKAACELQWDYSTVDYDGVRYWYR